VSEVVERDWWVLHVDLDEFLAAVEIARRPFGRHRRQQTAGQAGHGFRQAGGDIPADPAQLVERHGRSVDRGPVGDRPQDRPEADARGITTVAELARADPAELATRFGPTMGPWYRMLAVGAGGTDVTADRYVPRSRSRETTFQQDIADRGELEEQLVVLARRVAQDVGDEGRPVVRVAVKVRFAPFFTHTRSVTLHPPTSDPGEIAQAALTGLERFEHTRPVRLLGVRAEFGRRPDA
jgi:nucleotidyltransferase/DNA polymerase involved in DNA repair